MTTPSHTELAALLPCPFCGHDTPEFERLGTSRQSCIVICGDCGARHESSDEGARCGSSWNTRAAALESPERVLINGLNEDETAATASVVGLSTPPTAPAQDVPPFDDGLWGLFNEHNVPMKTRELIRNYFAATPSPQAERVPLSDEQIIDKCMFLSPGCRADLLLFARTIEAAHGIVTKESSNG